MRLIMRVIRWVWRAIMITMSNAAVLLGKVPQPVDTKFVNKPPCAGDVTSADPPPPPEPIVYLYDTFTHPNDTLLAGKLPDIGDFFWSDDSGIAKVFDNHVSFVGTTRFWQPVPVPNYVMTVDVNVVSDKYSGIMYRRVSYGSNWQILFAAGDAYIAVTDGTPGGGWSNVDSFPITDGEHSIKIVLDGQNHKIYLDDVLKHDADHPEYEAGATVGLISSGSTYPVGWIDNLRVIELV